MGTLYNFVHIAKKLNYSKFVAKEWGIGSTYNNALIDWSVNSILEYSYVRAKFSIATQLKIHAILH